ncbi:uncharacterized protein LOC62_05G007076 [Vanrija pseudolonga]|uniref:Uncharacterized protein n=1 Tax=Vanrija pseudolonga TaxID=143232 RepID=A0AAF0YHA4_9TREE|nr:hypothetical protein LOC62_05G007076 [Vanrija pseudolonga]
MPSLSLSLSLRHPYPMLDSSHAYPPLIDDVLGAAASSADVLLTFPLAKRYALDVVQKRLGAHVVMRPSAACESDGAAVSGNAFRTDKHAWANAKLSPLWADTAVLDVVGDVPVPPICPRVLRLVPDESGLASPTTPARVLVVHSRPDWDAHEGTRTLHIPPGVDKLVLNCVYHAGQLSPSLLGLSANWSAVRNVVLRFEPAGPFWPTPDPSGHAHKAGLHRLALLNRLVSNLLALGTSVTLVDLHTVPHLWLGLSPADGGFTLDWLTAKGRGLSIITSDAYADEYGDDAELETTSWEYALDEAEGYDDDE